MKTNFTAFAVSFVLMFGADTARSATITWTNTAGGNWSVPANWNPNQVPGPSDDALITSSGTYLVTLDTSPIINSLTLGAASGQQTLTNASFALTLNSASTIETNGFLALTGATLTGNNTVIGVLSVTGGAVNGTLTVLGEGIFNATNATLYGGPVTDGGTMSWNGVQFDPGAPLTVLTNGVLNIEGNLTLLSVLTNQGTVNWQAGEVAVDYYIPSEWYGEIWNETNALWNIQCDQTMQNYSGDEQFNNAGSLLKSAGSGTTSFNVFLDNSAAVEAQDGTFQINGGGNFGGGWVADSGGVIDLNGGDFTAIPGITVSGAGTVALTGGNLDLTQLNGLIGNLELNGGTMELPAGFQGGTITNFTLNGPTLLGGSNTVSGTLNLNGGGINGSLTILPGGEFNAANVTLIGPVTDGGTMSWNGVQFDPGAPLTVLTNGVLNIEGNLTLLSVLTNQGTVNWQAGEVAVDYYIPSEWYGEIWNETNALWNIQCDQTMQNHSGDEQFNNAGSLLKSAGTGTTTFGVNLNNTGTVQAQSGTIQFNSGGNLGGTFQADTGAAINFSGSYDWNGTAIFQGPGAVQIISGSVAITGTTTNFSTSGATITGFSNVVGTASLTNCTINDSETIVGVINCDGLSIIGYGPGNASTLTVATNGVLNLIGNDTHNIEEILVNYGTVNWQGGNIQVNANWNMNGMFYNEAGAAWNIQCDQTVQDFSYLWGWTSFFDNLGVLEKTAETNTTSFNLYLYNEGIIDAQSGLMSLNGGVDLTNGTMNFSISSLTNYGEVYLSENPSTLDGSVGVYLNNGYVPTPGDSFPVLTFTSASGSFTNFTNLSSSSGVIWQTNYTATSLVLTNVAQITWVPANITYGTALGANQLNAATTPTLAGTFTYSPAASAVMNSGAGQVLTTFFTPSNASYEPASFQVPITVLKAPLGITATNESKTYGQNFTFAGNEYDVYGLVNGDTVTNVSFASSGAISNAPVTGSPYEITPYDAQGDAGLTNYIIDYTNAVLTVNRAPLGITADSFVKTYGSNLVFPGTAFVSTALSNNETIGTVTLSSLGAVSTAPVSGSPYSISPNSAGGGTFSPGNYTITFTNGLLTVNRAALTVTANPASRQYGLTNPAFSVTYTGFVNNETASVVGGTPGFSTPATVTSGTGSYTVTPSLGTLSAANYTFAAFDNGTLTITTAPLAVSSGITANNKVYDRTTAATLSSNTVVLTNIFNGDAVSLNTNGYVANFASSNAGNNIAVTVSGLTLNGASSTNYTLAQPANLTANVTASPVTIASGIIANNKVYDRTTAATLSSNSVVLSGVINGDVVTLNTNGYIANFASAGVGASIPVTVSELTLSGASTLNYALTQPANLAANITAAQVTVTFGLTANNKVYDRTTTATLSSNSVVLSGVINGDTLNLNINGYAANFASAGVGNGIAVTVTGLTLTGASNADYALTQPATLAASITKAPVTISSGIAANNKVWDRTTTATLSSNNVVLSGVINGDTLNLNTNSYVANFATAALGTDIAVTVTGLTLTGASNADYTLTPPTDLNADITAPGVQISTSLPGIIVSWPTNAAEFELNQTASLVPPVTWIPVTNSIVVSGTNNTVNISTSAAKDLYFELIGTP